MRQGIDYVKQLGKTVNEIVSAVSDIAKQAQGIAVNSSSQAGNIEEINATVAGIDTNTQNAAAAAEDYLIRARALQDQTAQLRGALGRFGASGDTVRVKKVA